MKSELKEFSARRTPLDIKAAAHRLELVSRADFRPIALNPAMPVFALAGFLDPIVPWIGVRRWLRQNCSALREYRILRADHNVLGTAPRACANYVRGWMGVTHAPG
jgi:hypothetical protein